MNGTDLKEYKVSRVKKGTAKNGKDYTVFQVSDKLKKPDGSVIYDNYSVFTWQENINLVNDDKIVFTDIKALEVVETQKNGNTYINKTIFADIRPTSQANPNQVEVVGGLPNLEGFDDSQFPF